MRIELRPPPHRQCPGDVGDARPGRGGAPSSRWTCHAPRPGERRSRQGFRPTPRSPAARTQASGRASDRRARRGGRAAGASGATFAGAADRRDRDAGHQGGGEREDDNHAHRQLLSPTKPTSGMPTIHAAGWPTSAQESTCRRRSAGTHSAAASVAPVCSAATPTPSGTCASSSNAKLGARALAVDDAASNTAPAISWRASVRPTRQCAPRRLTVIAAARPATVRNWPAAAVDTSRSAASWASTGAAAMTAACAASRQEKRVMLTAVVLRVVIGRDMCGLQVRLGPSKPGSPSAR